MNCWKSYCTNKAAMLCLCSEEGIYSCENHIIEHFRLSIHKAHNPEFLSFSAYPGTKQALVIYLAKRILELNSFQSKLINDISIKIKELNSQLKTAIDEIKRVKNESNSLIEKISSAELLKKEDELGKILALDPDAAIKQLEINLRRINKDKFSGGFDICNFQNEWSEIYILKDKPRSLFRVNLNDLTNNKMEIPSLKETEELAISKFSDNRLFCILWNDNRYVNSCDTTIFFIYPDSKISYIPNRLHACKYVCPILYNDEVYAFGGKNSEGLLLTPEKYSISENKWKEIRKMSCGAIYCNGFTYKDQIFFVGNEHKNIYIYNTIQDTYKEIQAKLSCSGKVLFLKSSVFYVIESSSHILEIDIDDPNKLKYIGKCSYFGGSVSQITQFKDSVYFIGSGTSLYKFNLALRSAEILKLK